MTITKEGLSVPKALQMRDLALITAKSYRLSGAVSIASALKYEILTQLTDDDADPGTILIARGKIQTVLETKRSSSLQKPYMDERHYDRFDYMGRIGSLFGGGAAIFADEERKRFIGAMAFSGGTQDEDQQVCVVTVVDSDLFTDVEPSDALDKRPKV